MSLNSVASKPVLMNSKVFKMYFDHSLQGKRCTLLSPGKKIVHVFNCIDYLLASESM